MSRIPFFPTPVPGEAFQSVIARHFIRSATSTTNKLKMIGQPRASRSIILPVHLNSLVENIPQGHPWHENGSNLVRENSSIPFFLYFAKPEYKKQVLDSLCSGSIANPTNLMGLQFRSEIRLSKWLRFCPACVRQATDNHGFPVFYREHQISSLLLCAKHGTPLMGECVNCKIQQNHNNFNFMAGSCLCSSPNFQRVDEGREYKRISEIWLSQQVEAVHSLAEEDSHGNAIISLRSRLLDSGYGLKSGLNREKIGSALQEKFGKERVASLLGGDPTSSKLIMRRISTALNSIETIPNTMICLLLCALVAKSVHDLSNNNVVERKKGTQEPSGYGTRKSYSTTSLSLDSVQRAIKNSDGKITRAASLLKVSPSVFARELRRHQLEFQLSKNTEKRLGVELVKLVKNDLVRGIAKNKICHDHKISEWSLELIELTDVSLRGSHQKAVIDSQRNKHRAAVENFIRAHPEAGRSEVSENCPGAIDWIRTYDQDWLHSKFPDKKRPRKLVLRKPSFNVDVKDLDMANKIKIYSLREKNSKEKPRFLSRTRLFHEVGLKYTSLVKQKFVKTTLAVERHSESPEEYRDRRVVWAMKEYSNLNVSLSMNVLRRVASLPHKRIEERSALVISLARKYKIPIDDRSIFYLG